MSHVRDTLLAWNASGRLRDADLAAALRATGVYPDAAAWARFLRLVGIVAGGAMLAAALVFFIAHNWSAMTRAERLLLVEATVLCAVVVAAWRGPGGAAGGTALGVACIALGALLALVGQSYQTGADTDELFSAWALAILPLVILGRQGALWLLWLAIVNGAAELWLVRILDGQNPLQRMLWTLLALNGAALVAAELAFRSGLRESPLWVVRTVAVASAVAATALGLGGSFGGGAWRAGMGLGWLAWLGAIAYVYRVLRVDVFVLAIALASAIAVVSVFLTVHVFVHAGFLAPLAIGALVIGMAWQGTAWLRRIVAEEAS
ncbi:MAG: DUF2157 domain-containing protein [Proteobacteria bacterium]|nr:DUF2157 domain-containing protein [Pseudomonadota bacterium]